MEIVLKGKRALVGGSSGGIGKAVAQQLAESGASVTLMSRNKEKLESIVANLPTDQGQQHGFLVVDFNNFDRYSQQISQFFKDHTIDILVNNTQGPQPGNTLEKEVADYQQAFDLLFKSVVFTTELALKGMMERQWGRIINVASVSVKEPLSYLALSNTIRAAVTTWAKSLATDVGPFGITVNNVLTGYFATDRIAQLNHKKAEQMGIPEAEVLQDMESKVPVRRIGDPKEYGYLACFLASDRAAYLTGANIPLDGGLLKSM